MSAPAAKTLNSLRQAHREGRLTRMISNKLRWPLINPAAYIWRRLLVRTTFIAVTGSVGKTTFKELLVSILERHHPTIGTVGTRNGIDDRGMAATVLSVRPWHRFAIIEIGIKQPGQMRLAAKLLKPDKVVFLDVARCHMNNFKTLEQIAEEKAELLRYLGPKDHAVINQDNRYIAAVTSDLGCKKIGFGEDESADFRLLAAESRWPQRLSLTFVVRGRERKAETQLVGTHWKTSVMASLATADLCGVPLESALSAIRPIKPFWARLQPVALPSGATLLRDDWNGSIDTFEVARTVMSEAEAERKIVVFSGYSGGRKRDRQRANDVGRAAAELADLAVFVGHYADRSATAATAQGMAPESVKGFHSIADTIAFLRRELRKGDLVLIKGPANHHLARVFLGLLGPVSCSLLPCPLVRLCDQCPNLGFKWTPELDGFMAPPGSWA